MEEQEELIANSYQVPDSIEASLEQKIDESSEDEELEDILPDHYYDNGKIPVFKPTMKQFHSFKRFVKSIDSYGMQTGIVKIIPPNEWLEKLPDYTEKVKSIRLRNPIEQHIVGNGGCFRQTNVEKRQTYNLPKWRKLCESSDHLPPARRGEIRKTIYNYQSKKSENIKPVNNSSTSKSIHLKINNLSKEDQVEKNMDIFDNQSKLLIESPCKNSSKEDETELNIFLEKTSLNINIEEQEKESETIENQQLSKKKSKKKNFNKNGK